MRKKTSEKAEFFIERLKDIKNCSTNLEVFIRLYNMWNKMTLDERDEVLQKLKY